jgi:acyl-coenzyme A thioesterase PaaI-like protein
LAKDIKATRIESPLMEHGRSLIRHIVTIFHRMKINVVRGGVSDSAADVATLRTAHSNSF